MFLLVAGALLALRSGTGRAYVARTASKLLSDLLIGEIAIGSVRELSGAYVVLGDVVCRDSDGRVVVRAPRVEALLDVGALLHGDVILEKAKVQAPWVSLHWQADQLAIAQMFLPVPSTEPEATPAPSGDPFLFQIRQAIVQSGTVVEIPGGFSAQRVQAHGELSYSDAYRMSLSFVSGAVAHDQTALHGELGVKSATLRVATGEVSTLDAKLRFGQETLRVQLSSAWGEHGPARGNASARGTLTPAALTTAGLVETARLLRGAVALQTELSWDDSLDNVGLKLALGTPGGEVTLAATSDGTVRRAQLSSSSLQLSQTLALDDLPALVFDLELEAVQTAPGNQRLTLNGHQLTFNGHALPSWIARANLTPEGAQLTALEIAAWQAQRGVLDVDLRSSYAGDVQGSLSARVPRITRGSPLGRLSHARSDALRASVRGNYRAENHQLHLEGALQVSRLLIAGGSVADLNARVEAHGHAQRPVISVQASAAGLSFGKLRVSQLKASARGGPLRYEVKAEATAGKARALADLIFAAGSEEQRLSGSGQLLGFFPKPVVVSLGDVRIRSEAIDLHDVRASAGESLLALEGRYGRTRDSDLHLRVENLSLHVPTHEPTQENARKSGLYGRVSAHLHLMGQLTQPEATLALEVSRLALDGPELGELALNATLHGPRGEASAQLSLISPQGDGLQLLLNSLLPKSGSLLARLERAQHELAVQGKLELEHWTGLWQRFVSSEAPAGQLELSAHLHGPWHEPQGELAVTGRALSLANVGPLDAELKTQLSETNSQLALQLSDSHGPLASFSAEAQAAAISFVRALRDNTWHKLPGSYRFALSDHKLSDLPAPLSQALPINVAFQAELTTDPHTPPRAQLSGEARYAPSAASSDCKSVELPRLSLSGQLSEQQFALTLLGYMGDRHVLDAHVSESAPDLSLFQAATRAHNLALTLEAHDIDLARIPSSCGAVAGTVALSLRSTGLLSATPDLSLQLTVKGLHVGDAPPLDASLQAHADRTGLRVSSADLRERARPALHADGRLPWRWDGSTKPSLDLAHCEAHVQVAELNLATLLAAIPQLAQPTGLVDGKVELHGCGEPLDVRGQMTLKQAAFTVRDPLLRVDGLWANLRFSPEGISLQSFKLTDQGGALTGEGQVSLARGRLASAKLAFKARSYPLRSDADVAATFDGKINVTATLNQSPRRVRVALSELSVSLPERKSREAQALAQHADVVYVDRAAKQTREAEQGHAQPGTPLELEIIADEPFWVRRDDFGVQLQTRLSVRTGEAGARISGPVQVQRGFINMLSKGFDIKRGQLLFDGGEAVDPTVTIDAVHKLGDGQTVTIGVRGRLSAPVISFSTSVPGVATDAEVLQLLVRGRDASAAQTAQAQVGAALAGMTSGLFGGLSRTKFGKYVPVLSLEAGASSGTRMRAGVEANALIPARLRSVIEGAYVEGFVGSRNQGGDAQTTGGVLMELYFPKKVVTGGKWELPNNWSIEATWEP